MGSKGGICGKKQVNIKKSQIKRDPKKVSFKRR